MTRLSQSEPMQDGVPFESPFGLRCFGKALTDVLHLPHGQRPFSLHHQTPCRLEHRACGPGRCRILGGDALVIPYHVNRPAVRPLRFGIDEQFRGGIANLFAGGLSDDTHDRRRTGERDAQRCPRALARRSPSWLQCNNFCEIALALSRWHLNGASHGRLALALDIDRVSLGWQSDRRHTIKRMTLPASYGRAARDVGPRRP